jgi:hypothetical protein
MLNLVPHQTVRPYDSWEVLGRTFLGCIFGAILATTIIAHDVTTFFATLASAEIPSSNVLLLLPFFAGFSTTLVLNLFEKMIRAVELTIGVDDKRQFGHDGQRNGAAPRPNGSEAQK